MRLRFGGFLFAALILGALVDSTAAGPCQEQQDVLCGHYCSSNSCVNDAISRPEDACWLDFTTVPVTCEYESPSECCSGEPGM